MDTNWVSFLFLFCIVLHLPLPRPYLPTGKGSSSEAPRSQTRDQARGLKRTLATTCWRPMRGTRDQPDGRKCCRGISSMASKHVEQDSTALSVRRKIASCEVK